MLSWALKLVGGRLRVGYKRHVLGMRQRAGVGERMGARRQQTGCGISVERRYANETASEGVGAAC